MKEKQVRKTALFTCAVTITGSFFTCAVIVTGKLFSDPLCEHEHDKDHDKCRDGHNSAKGQNASAGDISEQLEKTSYDGCDSLIPYTVINGYKRNRLICRKDIDGSDKDGIDHISGQSRT